MMHVHYVHVHVHMYTHATAMEILTLMCMHFICNTHDRNRQGNGMGSIHVTTGIVWYALTTLQSIPYHLPGNMETLV